MPKIERDNLPKLTNRGAAGLLKKLSSTVQQPKTTTGNIPSKVSSRGINRITEALLPLAVDISSLVFDPENARVHGDRNKESIEQSLDTFTQVKPIVVQKSTRVVVAGNGTLAAAIKLGWTKVAATIVDMTDTEAAAFAIADNRTAELATWDFDILARLEKKIAEDKSYTGGMVGWSSEEVLAMRLREEPSQEVPTVDTKVIRAKLAERFIVPPFSILNSAKGYWQDRKNLWLSLGIESELGRDVKSYNVGDWMEKKGGGTRGAESGTSIFDPVLCELMYRWFCPLNGQILDPFAGGSVRGIVAGMLKRSYVGIDLRQEQVEANNCQVAEILKSSSVRYHVGDSSTTLPDLIGYENPELPLMKEVYDFVFTCPPYGDLEQYSNSLDDLSNMTQERFEVSYREIIKYSCELLKKNRFACFVVGNYRDSQSTDDTLFTKETRESFQSYHDLVGLTVRLFEEQGLHLYNEMIYITPTGSLPVRVGKQFTHSRKVGKCHQNVLVFVKGNAELATKACGPVDVTGFEQLLGD